MSARSLLFLESVCLLVLFTLVCLLHVVGVGTFVDDGINMFFAVVGVSVIVLISVFDTVVVAVVVSIVVVVVDDGSVVAVVCVSA